MLKGRFQNTSYIKKILGLTELRRTGLWACFQLIPLLWMLYSRIGLSPWQFQLKVQRLLKSNMPKWNVMLHPFNEYLSTPRSLEKSPQWPQKAKSHFLVSFSLFPYSNLPTNPLGSVFKVYLESIHILSITKTITLALTTSFMNDYRISQLFACFSSFPYSSILQIATKVLILTTASHWI